MTQDRPHYTLTEACAKWDAEYAAELAAEQAKCAELAAEQAKCAEAQPPGEYPPPEAVPPPGEYPPPEAAPPGL